MLDGCVGKKKTKALTDCSPFPTEYHLPGTSPGLAVAVEGLPHGRRRHARPDEARREGDRLLPGEPAAALLVLPVPRPGHLARSANR